ncbi:MAG: DJ-1/PfpI family protein [Oceanospirillaceae bacterium]|nr:DJ-1/PfpI family protein [Oceanospirillaceae bacterium]MCP5350033.1 DJ-1/PfpI family protein [Oceanospirillaceae bacterium]
MHALIVIANGSEEIETVTCQDLLVRAGIQVILASVSGRFVKMSRGLNLLADCDIDDVKKQAFDIVILPGGMPGAANLQKSEVLKELLLQQHSAGKWLAAICAAPAVVLAPLGLLKDQKATVFPGMEEAIPHYVDAPVVHSGNLITAQGPASAMAFALQIIEQLRGTVVAKEIAAQILYRP